jgi:hypothetical protein
MPIIACLRGELVARTCAGKRDSGLRKDRAEIEAFLTLVVPAVRCAALVAAKRWEDARRGAQRDSSWDVRAAVVAALFASAFTWQMLVGLVSTIELMRARDLAVDATRLGDDSCDTDT